MCTYSISIEDTLIEQLKPTLGADSDVNDWMQCQIELAVLRYIQQLKSKSMRQEAIQRIIALSEADGSTISVCDFEGILPAPQSSLEELRDEYKFKRLSYYRQSYRNHDPRTVSGRQPIESSNLKSLNPEIFKSLNIKQLNQMSNFKFKRNEK